MWKSTLFLILILSLIAQSNGMKVPFTEMEKLNALFKKMSIDSQQYKNHIKTESNEDTGFDEINSGLLDRQITPVLKSTFLAFTGYIECSSPSLCWGVRQSSLYKSVDALATWTSVINTSFPLDGVMTFPDPNYILVLGANSSNIITSTNGGISWNVYSLSIYLVHVRMHPIDSNYLLAWNGYDSGIYVSKDFAKTWTLYQSGPTYDLAWCPHYLKGGKSLYDICFITNGDLKGPSKTGRQLFMSSDIDKTSIYVPLNNTANYMIEHPRFFFVLGESSNLEGQNLFVSKDNGTTFFEAIFPHEDHIAIFEPTQLLDDRFEIFIASTYDTNTYGVQQGALYVADGSALIFSEILTDALSNNNIWDFEPIRSIEGAYVANQVVDFSKNNYFVQTLITYDNGATWSRLTPPTKQFNGSEVICEDPAPCYLNLFGYTTFDPFGGSGYGPIYSGSSTTVGFLIGTGNIGSSLSTVEEDVRTYLSNDAGETWREIFGFSTIYEYGDHGGLIVAAQNQGSTNVLYYSLDMGYTWTSWKFSDKKVNVINFHMISHSMNTMTLVAYQSSKKYYYTIDFSPVMSTTVCGDGDYYEWELADSHGMECYLGHNTWYRMRVNGSTCDNPNNYNPISRQENCKCSDQDYECDTGFFPVSFDASKCASFSSSEPRIMSDCFSNGTQWVSGGYRRAVGDTCVGDLPNKLAVLHGCSYSSHSSGEHHSHGSKKGAIAAVVIILVLLIIGAVAFIFFARKNEFLREKLPFLAYFERRAHAHRYGQLNTMDDEEM